MGFVVTEEVQEAWRDYTGSADQLLAEAARASTSGRQHETAFRGLDRLSNNGFTIFAAFYIKAAAERSFEENHIRHCWKAIIAGRTQEQMMEDPLRLEVLLISSFEMLAAVVQQTTKLLSSFSQQAWKSLKLEGGEPCLLLHTIQQDYQTFAAVAVLQACPFDFQAFLTAYFRKKLDQYCEAIKAKLGAKHIAFVQASDDEDEEGESAKEDLEGMETDSHEQPSPALFASMAQTPAFTRMQSLAKLLKQLQMEEVSSRAYEAVITTSVQNSVEKRTRGKLTKSVLTSAHSYVGDVILPFLALLRDKQGEGQKLTERPYGGVGKSMQPWDERLTAYIFRTVGLMRIEDLFNIAKIFPDSAEAVQDLEECMQECDLQRTLIRVFRASCASRLHIPGAKTNDIIDIYVNSIKILRQVDPTGVLFEAVSGPTREYLQGRKDTIRSIVTAMTDDKSEVAGESLFEELQRPALQDGDDEEKEDDAFARYQLQTWEPDPANADVLHPVRAERMNDIISMLVQIYGSKDLFINEYRGMLAERLLAKSSFDNNSEIRTLEHLKMRFGEGNLHSCEVMMKDLGDSKRLFNTIKAMPNNVRSPVRERKRSTQVGIGPLSATIISALFWPPLQEEQLKLPDEIEDHLNEYAAKYWAAKQPRKLIWKKHLGAVELTLRIGPVSRDFTVPPFEAAILMNFQWLGTGFLETVSVLYLERKGRDCNFMQSHLQSLTWSAEGLARELQTSVDVLRRKAAFWVKHGVLIESQSRLTGLVSYTRSHSLDSGGGGAPAEPIAMEEDESSSALVSVEDQLKREMAMYEQYILGMLTNFEAGLPLDRIHNMLKMFVPDQAYDKSSEQLASFLGQLVADEKLKATGNVYSKS